MLSKTSRSILAGASLITSVSVSSAALIMDDFDTDTSANYTVAGGADGTSAFAFDYSTVGIPSAPNTVGGTTSGLRFTANDTVGASDTITAFNNIAVTGSYRLSVDIFMAVQGTGGTTEFGHVGVAGDGSTLNTVFSPISGSGHFIAFTGEGGSGSDFRHFTPSGTTLPNTHPSYLGHGSNGTGAFFQGLYPSPAYQFAGSPGNSWTTLTIDVIDGGNVSYSLDGSLVFETAEEDAGDKVSLGYADVFSSVANPSQSQFVVYDNLTVEAIPEPSVPMLIVLLGGAFGLRRRR